MRAIWLQIFCLVTMTTQTSAFIPPATCVETRDRRFNGDKYQHVENLSLDECKTKCLSNTKCVGFEYQNDGDTIWCMAHQEIYTFAILTPGASDSAKRWAYRCRPQLELENADYQGLDFKNVPAQTASHCSYLCDETKGCNAFSWNDYNGGTCWMKSNKDETVVPTNGAVVSGESFRAFRGYWKNTDIVGYDLSSVQRSNWKDCLGVCRRNPKCGAFTWTNYNGGTCWLKFFTSETYDNGYPLKDSVGAVSMRVETAKP